MTSRMMLTMTHHSAFSLELFSWEAKMPVGSRGSLSWSYRRDGESEQGELRRWHHGLHEASFLATHAELSVLPAHCGPVADDAGAHQLVLSRDGEKLVRTRHAWPLASDEDARAFDRLWQTLLPPIYEALRARGVPFELLDGEHSPG